MRDIVHQLQIVAPRAASELLKAGLDKLLFNSSDVTNILFTKVLFSRPASRETKQPIFNY